MEALQCKIFTLLAWLTTISNAQLIGQIGQVTDKSASLPPANVTIPFYLSTASPASARGYVTSISYCYMLNRQRTRVFRATVGFYRPAETQEQRLVLNDSFNITKRAGNGPRERVSQFQCEKVAIPPVMVEVGDVIGVCSGSARRPQVGAFNFFAVSGKDTGSGEVTGLVGDDELCGRDGGLPKELASSQLANTMLLLLVYADIIAIDSEAVTRELLATDITPSQKTVSVKYVSVTSSSTVETKSDLNPLLSTRLPTTTIVGVAVGGALLLVIFATLCVACACCCHWWRKKRSRLQAEAVSSTNYYAFGDNTIQHGSVKPHIIGPEHISSSAQYATVQSTSSKPLIHPRRKATPSSATAGHVHSMDTTTVVYTVLQTQSYSDRVPEANFELPASKEDQIYAQLESCGSRTLKRGEIRFEETASGSTKAVWKYKDRTYDIHLREGTNSEDDKISYLQEAAILAQFKHPNVITYYGVFVDDMKVTIVEELLCCSLKTFLLRLPEHAMFKVTPKKLLNFSQQVALGMQYLSRKGFVHGKVMAASVMLSSSNVCKIIDFSWSRDIANGDIRSLQAPVKWSAPEVTSNGLFSSASDVWSYGCLLYEIWSLGKDPYTGESSRVVMEWVRQGKRLAPPPGCPKVIYELMMESWNPDVRLRPSFTQLVTDLTRVEALVLRIPQELLEKHPECGELGGPLSVGTVMYPDIQNLYGADQSPSTPPNTPR